MDMFNYNYISTNNFCQWWCFHMSFLSCAKLIILSWQCIKSVQQFEKTKGNGYTMRMISRLFCTYLCSIHFSRVLFFQFNIYELVARIGFSLLNFLRIRNTFAVMLFEKPRSTWTMLIYIGLSAFVLNSSFVIQWKDWTRWVNSCSWSIVRGGVFLRRPTVVGCDWCFLSRL